MVPSELPWSGYCVASNDGVGESGFMKGAAKTSKKHIYKYIQHGLYILAKNQSSPIHLTTQKTA